ncbi:MAG: hypothetical protein PHC97_01440 [Patescibacteria group bacterium]|nr:hypothetical protein [Patescibacteria group bacterium]
MAKESIFKLIGLLLLDELKAILYFPLWWYSRGFLNLIKAGGSWIINFDKTLGFTIWLKNLFVPMFGQRDLAGRLISFLLRLVQIIFRGILLLIFIMIVIIIFILWLALPFFIIYEIILQL